MFSRPPPSGSARSAYRTLAPTDRILLTSSVSRADAERFAVEARDATVVDVDADHYSILTSPPAISAVGRFVGAGTA